MDLLSAASCGDAAADSDIKIQARRASLQILRPWRLKAWSSSPMGFRRSRATIQAHNIELITKVWCLISHHLVLSDIEATTVSGSQSELCFLRLLKFGNPFPRRKKPGLNWLFQFIHLTSRVSPRESFSPISDNISCFPLSHPSWYPKYADKRQTAAKPNKMATMTNAVLIDSLEYISSNARYKLSQVIWSYSSLNKQERLWIVPPRVDKKIFRDLKGW